MKVGAPTLDGLVKMTVPEGSQGGRRLRWRAQGLRQRHGGYEYQIRIILEDGTEKLSEWMNSPEQVAQAVIVVRKLQGKTCRLLIRNIICPIRPEREHILECPVMEIPSPKCIPYDFRHLRAAESRDRCALGS
jgi:hypothetical protein